MQSLTNTYLSHLCHILENHYILKTTKYNDNDDAIKIIAIVNKYYSFFIKEILNNLHNYNHVNKDGMDILDPNLLALAKRIDNFLN